MCPILFNCTSGKLNELKSGNLGVWLYLLVICISRLLHSLVWLTPLLQILIFSVGPLEWLNMVCIIFFIGTAAALCRTQEFGYAANDSAHGSHDCRVSGTNCFTFVIGDLPSLYLQQKLCELNLKIYNWSGLWVTVNESCSACYGVLDYIIVPIKKIVPMMGWVFMFGLVQAV